MVEKDRNDTIEEQAGAPDKGQVAGAPKLPEMDFSTFVVSLGTSAMIHLGEGPATDGVAEKALPLAKQTIDILAMLEEKTRGNLDAQEARLISDLLYDLRLRFVDASK